MLSAMSSLESPVDFLRGKWERVPRASGGRSGHLTHLVQRPLPGPCPALSTRDAADAGPRCATRVRRRRRAERRGKRGARARNRQLGYFPLPDPPTPHPLVPHPRARTFFTRKLVAKRRIDSHDRYCCWRSSFDITTHRNPSFLRFQWLHSERNKKFVW